jgi:hypothetical protein
LFGEEPEYLEILGKPKESFKILAIAYPHYLYILENYLIFQE